MPKLIIGCGYVGLRVARRWIEAGQQVFALTRSASRADELHEAGISPIVGDVTKSLALPDSIDFDTVLYAVGFDRTAEHSIEEVYVEGFSRALAALSRQVKRLIYLSSTGVYGQTAGQWVDEDSPCHPQRRGGRAVLAAERRLADHPLGELAVVLRLAGIYGSGRVPKLQAVRAGEPLTAKGDSFLNLIHVDDVVAAVLAAEQIEMLPARFLVSDGCPVRRADFYAELARQLGVSPPVFDHSAGQPTPREMGSKRVRNSKMQADLLPQLRFPSYRQGLADVVKSVDP